MNTESIPIIKQQVLTVGRSIANQAPGNFALATNSDVVKAAYRKLTHPVEGTVNIVGAGKKVTPVKKIRLQF